MSAIKVRKRLTKFKITIALHKTFGSMGFFTVIKVIKIWRSSGESYKLRYVYPIWGTPGDIAIQKREIAYIKIKIVKVVNVLVTTTILSARGSVPLLLRCMNKIILSLKSFSEIEWRFFNWFHTGAFGRTVLTIYLNGSASLKKIAIMPIYGTIQLKISSPEPRSFDAVYKYIALEAEGVPSMYK